MRTRLLVVLMAVLLPSLLTPVGVAEAADKQDGVAFTGWWNDAYDGRPPEDAMANLANSNAGWASILSTWYQPTYTSTHIAPTDATPTDDGVVHMIQTAHDLGTSVMLKSHVDLSDTPTTGGDRSAPGGRAGRRPR